MRKGNSIFFLMLFFLILAEKDGYTQIKTNKDYTEYQVRVEGTTDGWQNTSINLKKGEIVLFEAPGEISYGKNIKKAHATGFAASAFLASYNKPGFKIFKHGALICQNDAAFVSANFGHNLVYDLSISSQKVPKSIYTVLSKIGFIGNYFVSSADQQLKFMLNDNKCSDNEGAYDVTVYVVPGCPDLDGLFDLATLVDTNNGTLNFCFKENCSSLLEPDNSYWAGGENSQGHYYLNINPLGHSNISVAAAAALLFKNIYKIFPGGAVDVNLKSNPGRTEVLLLHEYELTNMDFWWQNYEQTNPPLPKPGINPKVKAVVTTNYYFKFLATPHHLLEGSAIHGVFKDACGDLYMFQQGRGTATENALQRNLNLFLAKKMWSMMANNMKSLL